MKYQSRCIMNNLGEYLRVLSDGNGNMKYRFQGSIDDNDEQVYLPRDNVIKLFGRDVVDKLEKDCIHEI